MYCYECGSKVYNGITRCPYCDTEFVEMNDVYLDNLLDDMHKHAEGIKKNNFPLGCVRKMSFQLDGNEIVLSEDTYVKRNSFAFFEQLKIITWSNIEKWLNETEYDDIVEKCESFETGQNEIIAFGAMAYLRAVGEKVTLQILADLKECIAIHNCFSKAILTSGESFKELKTQMDMYNDRDRVQYSPKWRGGGRTFKGAIEGVLTAEALNLAEGALTQVGNVVKRNRHAKENRQLIEQSKRIVKESQEFKKNLKAEWEDHINWAANYTNVNLKKNEANRVDYWVKMEVPVQIRKYTIEDAVAVLNKDPYDLNAYLALYAQEPKNRKTLLEIATNCGIRELVQRTFLGHFDYKIIDSLEASDMGIGVNTKELAEYKELIDGMDDYQEMPDLVYAQKQKELKKKMAELLQQDIIFKAQDKFDAMIRKEPVIKVLAKVSLNYDDYEYEVVFQKYYNRLCSLMHRNNGKEFNALFSQLNEAAKKGYLLAEDIIAQYEWKLKYKDNGAQNGEKAKSEEENRILEKILYLAAKGAPHAQFLASEWGETVRKELLNKNVGFKKFEEYRRESLRKNCALAMVSYAKQTDERKISIPKSNDEERKQRYMAIAELLEEESTKGFR